jgi:small-conductance mechanosensitive channel
MRNALASVWHWIALFFIVAIWLVWAVEIPDGFTRLLHFFIVTALLLIGARLTMILLEGSLDRVLTVPPETAARYPGLEARLRLYHPAISALLRAVLYVLCVLALLQLYGFGAFTWFGESELGHRVVSALGTIVVTLLLAFAAWEAANAAIQRHLAKLAKDQQLARSARLRTLLPLMRSALVITIVVVAGMMVLSEIGINIAPLLAGAGIIGVAIGFGSQKLVQDLITGIFLLLENAMQVGDNVTVSGLSGTVENLSVRTIRLRAGDGSVHIIPFSAVTTVTNVNRGLGNAPVSVTVDYAEDTDRVAAVLAEIVSGMRAEPDFASKMLSDLQLWGVDKVDGAEATIVGQVVCTDSGRWSVQREFNRRMKQRFQELGIRLYNPMRSVAVTLPAAAPSEAPRAAPQGGEPPAEPSPGAAGQEQAHEQSRAAD